MNVSARNVAPQKQSAFVSAVSQSLYNLGYRNFEACTVYFKFDFMIATQDTVSDSDLDNLNCLVNVNYSSLQIRLN